MLTRPIEARIEEPPVDGAAEADDFDDDEDDDFDDSDDDDLDDDDED